MSTKRKKGNEVIFGGIVAIIICTLLGTGVYMLKNIRGSDEATDTAASVDQASTDYFSVYGADSQAVNTEVNFYIELPKELTLTEKLKAIADRLSRFKFNELPIEIKGIDEKDGRKIAVVNLKEHPWNEAMEEPPVQVGNRGATWRYLHFQGSLGGEFTSKTLVETFLQQEYKGEWIDGVTFLYGGNPIEEFEHVQLSGVFFND